MSACISLAGVWTASINCKCHWTTFTITTAKVSHYVAERVCVLALFWLQMLCTPLRVKWLWTSS
jgi:hypothetical protein